MFMQVEKDLKIIKLECNFHNFASAPLRNRLKRFFHSAKGGFQWLC